MSCPCPKHPFGCYGHPIDCGCSTARVNQMALYRLALEQIDAVVVAKKAGALVKVQRIARKALALPSQQGNTP